MKYMRNEKNEGENASLFLSSTNQIYHEYERIINHEILIHEQSLNHEW